MENSDIARVLSEIADLLEIQGDPNPFRVRSYQKGAEAIESYAGSVERLAADEDPRKLLEIPGVGASIAGKIREICETGDCQERKRLLEQTPASLLELLSLQNLGPRKINLFHKTLQIRTLDDLERAARAQELRALPGMGEKSEQKILQSIEQYRRSRGRMRLSEAMEISDGLVNWLRSSAALDRIEVAGSLRRRRETIGDIDILVTCKQPGAVLDAFTGFRDVQEVLGHGETKASVRLGRGLQADLRVLPDESFGAALQYFTGSKTHNIALRERARRGGYKVSEYGVFTVGDDRRVAGATEEEIYRLLDLDFIPPELREDLGEIEAAEKHTLPELLERRHIRGDLHSHTTATDGHNSIEEMARAAEALGYEYLAITDHSKAVAMTGGLDEARLLKHVEAIEQVQKTLKKIRLLKGIEVDILADGSLDLDDSVLQGLDVVVASVHSRMNMERAEMTARICRALRNPNVDILGHPTGRILRRRDAYLIDIEEVVRVARQEGVALELNSNPARLDLNDVHCRLARDSGVPVVVSTDAHSTSMFEHIEYGVSTARRGWLGPGNVLNTLPLDELLRRLKARSNSAQK